jgi:hypothetical protein
MATVVAVPGRRVVVAPHHSGLLGRKDDLSSVAEAIVKLEKHLDQVVVSWHCPANNSALFKALATYSERITLGRRCAAEGSAPDFSGPR